MNLTHIKIGKRLFIAFGLVTLISMVTDGLAMHKLSSVQANLEKIVTVNNVKMDALYDMAKAVHIKNRVIRTMLLLDDANEIKQQSAKLDAADKLYAQAWTRLQKFPPGEKAKALRALTDESRAITEPLLQKLTNFALQNQDKEAQPLLINQVIPAANRWLDAIDENIELQQQSNEAEYTAAALSYLEARNTLLAAALASVLLSALLAWAITRSVTRPVATAIHAAERVTQGDLTVPIQSQGADETAQLLTTLGSMQGGLNTIVGGVRQNAGSLATASEQIAQGNHDLSARTEQQASALEQTAASLEELSAAVHSNAEHAKEANQLAIDASAVAVQGGEVVAQVVSTMRGINESSRQISDIISVIDGIAFQTNILALNAAVEAARAGEQGRGFAVVATEVRTLAGKSAQAAKEIKSLISASVERVEHGTALVDRAGETMTQVVDSIQKVTRLMGDISLASREQSQGVAEVDQAIQQMDQVTQQNAAMVEEMAAAAASLNQQAQDLVSIVAVFQLRDEPAHRAEARPEPQRTKSPARALLRAPARSAAPLLSA
ncbi:MAG: HAMP domain-containing protein [Betaproteobacteria bacterium]|nr:HAMP domain-containing protein [Betaproteobacteria bacterium]